MLDLISVSHALLVSEQLSFRGAAAVIGTPPSVVSSRVRGLEDELGVSLFERHSGGVRVTAAGRRFFERARSALAELDYAAKSAASAGRGAEGHLRVGIFASIASLFGREVIAAFAERHRKVEVDLAEGGPREHLALLREGRLDAAFVVYEPQVQGLEAEAMWTERMAVALPEQHPLAGYDEIRWEALCGERFLISRDEPGPTVHDHVIFHLAGLGHHPEVEAYAVSRETLANLVGLGFGLSIVSEAATAVSYPGVVYRFIEGDTVPFSLVWAPAHDNPIRNRFVSLAKALASGRRLPDGPEP